MATKTKTLSQTKKKYLKDSKANTFMAIDPQAADAVAYGGGSGSGAVVSPTTKDGSLQPSIDPDYIPTGRIDPIVSEVDIVAGGGIIVDPAIKVPSDSPILPVGVLETSIDPVPPPPKLPVVPIDPTLTPTVDNKGKKAFAWIALAVVAVVVIYFLSKGKK